MIGVIGSVASSVQTIGGGGGGGGGVPTVNFAGGIATASYSSIIGEKTKPPLIYGAEIQGDPETGEVLTIVVTGEYDGPFTPAPTQYQWYKVTVTQGGTLTAIPGATNQTYTPVAGDIGAYLIGAARLVQLEGANNTSPWFYTEMTAAIIAGSNDDITYAWQDYLDFTSGVPANWNDVGVSPSMPNGGSAAAWTTVEATKPVYDFVNNEMTFTSHKLTGHSETHPPLFEQWTVAKFTGGSGNLVSMGNQVLLAINASNQYQSNGLANQAGDLNEHVFRQVFNGANSIFQVDGGTEVVYDENTTIGTVMVIGQTQSGANSGKFKIKKYWKTPRTNFLTTQQVADRWAFFGF